MPAIVHTDGRWSKKWITIHIRDQGTRVYAHVATFHLMRTNCALHTQPRWGVVPGSNYPPPTVHYSEQILYAAILQRASHHVRYSELGGCPLFVCFYFIISMKTAVGACNSVRYLVDVRYWECPLIEIRLYYLFGNIIQSNF